jgi:NAD(P)-dependent dehydrogenase (short-subunit alcohol dehydrogenase family)
VPAGGPAGVGAAGRLVGKVAIVTGAASGIGRAIAARFAEAGAVVVVADIDLDGATAAAAELGVPATAEHHDVADEASWERVVAGTVTAHGRLDVLVNGAGIAGSGAPQDPERVSLDEWRAIFRVNLDGVMLGCREAIPALRAGGGGSIVNISSVAARIATPHVTPYGAAKAGVSQLTESIALHCARKGYGIRCNAIEPGTIETALTEQVFTWGGRDAEAGRDAFRRLVPLGRLGEPDDIAHAAVYLASDEAAYVTGTSLRVDGGWSIPH